MMLVSQQNLLSVGDLNMIIYLISWLKKIKSTWSLRWISMFCRPQASSVLSEEADGPSKHHQQPNKNPKQNQKKRGGTQKNNRIIPHFLQIPPITSITSCFVPGKAPLLRLSAAAPLPRLLSEGRVYTLESNCCSRNVSCHLPALA